ncbi:MULTISPECIES: hypothetical protein [unclassified Rhizobacter]|uniref:hypothetical protein n=1 Tax=unclassified Rhizobacter TaxID=2640088 RepID=UPI0012FCFFA7|nr:MULTISPECIES: hypothetical protein [unclassified Rhizobacter]
MKPVVALVEWFGPYSLESAKRKSAGHDDGLYVVIGRRPQEDASRVQYIGLGSNLHRRLNGVHHAIPKVTDDCEIWLGDVISPRTPGRKIKVTDRMLDLVEWAHAYFLQLPLNSMKKARPPDRPIAVYNKWWQKNATVPYKRRPHRDWPDIIDYFGDEFPAKLVWFGGRQVIGDVASFKAARDRD